MANETVESLKKQLEEERQSHINEVNELKAYFQEQVGGWQS